MFQGRGVSTNREEGLKKGPAYGETEDVFPHPSSANPSHLFLDKLFSLSVSDYPPVE